MVRWFALVLIGCAGVPAEAEQSTDAQADVSFPPDAAMPETSLSDGSFWPDAVSGDKDGATFPDKKYCGDPCLGCLEVYCSVEIDSCQKVLGCNLKWDDYTKCRCADGGACNPSTLFSDAGAPPQTKLADCVRFTQVCNGLCGR